MSSKAPIGIDLFSGAGGMSLGFEQAGFNIAGAVEVDPLHCMTHKKNFPDCVQIEADITQLNGNDLLKQCNLDPVNDEIDVLFGGPPCGGFSLIGRRLENDPRNSLILEFGRLIGEITPKYFVIENVRGILIGEMKKKVDEFISKVESFGYDVITPIQYLNAADFGVPQKRERVIIIGYKKGLKKPQYPKRKVENSEDYTTVWDAIGDLPNVDEIDSLRDSDLFTGKLAPSTSIYASILRGDILDPDDKSKTRVEISTALSGCQQTQHNKQTIIRFTKTEPGQIESISRLYRLTKEGVSRTLRAGTGKEHGSYSAPRPIHPINNRCITVREGARIHSFPDWFQFHQTKWHGFRQIGNSVPPMLANAVAKEVIKILE